MNARALVAALALVSVLATGVTVASCPPAPSLVTQSYVTVPGFAEPHTPGSGVAGAEMPASLAVQRVLGASPDLNRVTYVRTFLPKPSGAPPRAVVILVPGFISGAAAFNPLARQLVQRFNGNLEVWVIDRRPNQVEDRRGTQYGLAQMQAANEPGFVDALQFYFPDEDPAIGTTPFPGGSGDIDVDGDGIFDPPFALPDALGGATPFQQIGQDDLRFAAHWGIDTYARDWKVLVDLARGVVGPTGLVLFGGHSAGTGFSGIFAAYDFDAGPGVDPAHAHIDGLLLLEGGGPGVGSSTINGLTQNGNALPTAPARPTTTAGYDALVAQIAATGGIDVFLGSFAGATLSALGAGAEIGGIDATFRPGLAAYLQRTRLVKSLPLSFILGAPMTTETLIGLFVDDDHSPVAALTGSFGFSDNGPNQLFPFSALLPGASNSYLAQAAPGGALRSWKNFDDPSLPTCPPNDPLDVGEIGTGCAISDRGPRPNPTDPPARWGLTAEPSDMDEFVRDQHAISNFLEWYYLSGRITLDLSYGRDASPLGDESRLAVTQNATMDKPVLCVGGSNGLAPTEASFQGYLASIATPAADKEIFVAEGYAHLDVLTASNNLAVPPIVDWVNRLLQRKLLGAP
jgi:hypothetical protein